jgi:glycerol-1-phosphate dehydrogenase [NAD(P)+]
MPLLARVLGAPLSVDIGPHAVASLSDLLSDSRISPGGHVAVALGPGVGEEVAGLLRASGLGDGAVYRVDSGTVEAAWQLIDELQRGSYDALVGIGGGRTIDVTKYAATRLGLPMVSVATSLAHDGLASPVASLVGPAGKTSFGVQIPMAVIVDLDFVRRSPVRQRRSGVGEVISNLSACADWQLSHEVRGEPVDGLARMLANTAAEAVLHNPGNVDSDAFLSSLAEALVVSGLAMAVAGNSRPCSGACHEISHALDLMELGGGMHGEQVAVGALFASFLRKDPLLDAMDACLHRHGVPRLPGDLGLTEDEFARAVAYGPSTRPDRYTVLEHLDLDDHEIGRAVRDFVAAFDH